MKTEAKKKIKITLNEQEAFVLQNILYSFDWEDAGKHYFADLYYALKSITDREARVDPWIEKEALLKILRLEC